MKTRETKEIVRVRLRLLDLVKSFFFGEPDAERMSRWRGTFSALAKERVNPAFDRSVVEIGGWLQNNSLESLQDEYYKLFTDPFSDKELQLSASYYLSGKSYGKTLIDIRTLTMEAGIERKEGVVDTEDSLPVMLDIYARLIEEEEATGDDRYRGLQEELLGSFLLPFADKLIEAADNNEHADFYSSCCRFLCGYLEMEKELAGVTA